MSFDLHGRVSDVHGENVVISVGQQGNINYRVPSTRDALAARARDGGVVSRMGFGLDVMSYSARPDPLKVNAQRRLANLVKHVGRTLNVRIESTSQQSSGDGVIAFLPPETELHRALPTLLRACVEWTAADNATYRDRLRLRMAVVFGPVSPAPMGFSGNTVVECCRLLECEPLRQRLVDHEDADIAAIVSEPLYAFTVREGHVGLDPAQFEGVHVMVKSFEADAWLWVGA